MLNRKKIAFISDDLKPYNEAWASTRLRVYNVINYFNSKYFFKYKLELFEKGKKYDMVIFQKAYFGEYLDLARNLKNKGVKIVFDINIDVFALNDNIKIFSKQQKEKFQNQKRDVVEMLNLSDAVITPSEHLLNLYLKYNKKTFLIEEAIEDKFIKVKKNHKNKEIINLLYSGYSKKAQDIEIIKDVLKKLYDKYSNLNLLFLSDVDPNIDFMPSSFLKFDFPKVHKYFLLGDIKIAPRDLNLRYNLGHTVNKIAYPMAVGLPVVASAVPSYSNRGILICNDEEEWYQALSMLIEDASLRQLLGNKNKNYIKSNLSLPYIGKQYLELFNFLLT
jgi:glycosyltransferase involved in cell wall biosynthesis